jgi:hypothetical protein
MLCTGLAVLGLCTGLAVLGLCFPIPGVTSRSQLEQAKWGPFIAEGESDWWVTGGSTSYGSPSPTR